MRNAGSPPRSGNRTAEKPARRQKIAAPILALAVLMLSSKAFPADANTRGSAQAGGKWWTKCLGIADGSRRLACFDASVPAEGSGTAARDKPEPSNSDEPGRSANSLTRQGEGGNEGPARYRFALGYGMGIAGHHGSFKVERGRLDLRDGIGNSGDVFFAEGWRLGWPGKNWMVGLEYIHFHNDSDMIFNLPYGFSILTDPVTAIVHSEVGADLGIANIAYSPVLTWPVRPYIGIGAGIGVGNGYFSLKGYNTFVGPFSSVDEGSAPLAMFQGQMGINIPLHKSYFMGLHGKILWITGHPVAVDQRYANFVFAASIGREF